MKRQTPRIDFDSLLAFCLAREQDKVAGGIKLLSPAEQEKLITDDWEILYLSLCRVAGERETAEEGETVSEMLTQWARALDEDNEKDNLAVRGRLIRLAGRLGEQEYVYCPLSKEFAGSPLNLNLAGFGKLEEWHREKIFRDIQQEISRLLSPYVKTGENFDELIDAWIDFYNYLLRLRAGRKKGKDLYARKVMLLSLNAGGGELQKSVSSFLVKIPSPEVLSEMSGLEFYPLAKEWNLVFLSFLECRAELSLAGSRINSPVAGLLERWRELGKYIGRGGESDEAKFQNLKTDIVYYTVYISRVLHAPLNLKNSVMELLSCFADSRSILDPPSHRTGFLKEDWGRALFLMERFRAGRELASRTGKDMLSDIQELLYLWGEFESIAGSKTRCGEDEKRFPVLRAEIIRAYYSVSSFIGTGFLDRHNLLYYASLSRIRELPSREQLLEEWHEHYIKLHRVFDDCLAGKKDLDFKLMGKSLASLIAAWRKMGDFLSGGEGEFQETRDEAYRTFKSARKNAPVLAGTGIKLMNYLASLPGQAEWERLPEPAREELISGWDRILTGLLACRGKAGALEEKQLFDRKEKRFRAMRLRRKKLLKHALVLAMALPVFITIRGVYFEYMERREQIAARLTYRPGQREAPPAEYSFSAFGRESARAVFKDGGMLWAVSGQNLIGYPLAGGREKRIPIPSSGRLQALHADSNFVWLGTDTEILRFDKTTGSWRITGARDGLAFNNLTVLLVKGRTLWLGTESGRDWEGGILSYNTLSGRTRRYTRTNGLPGNDVTALEMVGDSIWAGTKTGAGIYDLEKREWEQIPGPGAVNCIALDEESFVWLGGLGEVHVYDIGRDAWKTHAVRQGLSYWINDIFVQKDYVWLASGGSGLIRYSKHGDSWEAFNSRRNRLLPDNVQNVSGQMDRIWLNSAGLFGGGISEIRMERVAD